MTMEGACARAFQPQRWVVEVPHAKDMSKEAVLFALKEAEDMGPFVELVLLSVLTESPAKSQGPNALEEQRRYVETAVLRPFSVLASTKDVKSFTFVEVAENHQQGLCAAVAKFSAARLYLNTKKHFSLLRRTSSAVQYLETHLPRGVAVVVVKGGKKTLETLSTGERQHLSRLQRSQYSEGSIAASVTSDDNSEGCPTPTALSIERTHSLGSPAGAMPFGAPLACLPPSSLAASPANPLLGENPRHLSAEGRGAAAAADRWHQSSTSTSAATLTWRHRPSQMSSDFSDLSAESFRRSFPSDGEGGDVGCTIHSVSEDKSTEIVDLGPPVLSSAGSRGAGTYKISYYSSDNPAEEESSRRSIDGLDEALMIDYFESHSNLGSSARYTEPSPSASSALGRSARHLGDMLALGRRRPDGAPGRGDPGGNTKGVFSAGALPLVRLSDASDPCSRSERWGPNGRPWEPKAEGGGGAAPACEGGGPEVAGRPPLKPPTKKSFGARSKSSSGNSLNTPVRGGEVTFSGPIDASAVQVFREASSDMEAAGAQRSEVDTAALLEEIAKLRKTAEAAQAAAAAAEGEAKRAREEAQQLMKQVSPTQKGGYDGGGGGRGWREGIFETSQKGAHDGGVVGGGWREGALSPPQSSTVQLLAKIAPGLAASLAHSASFERWQAGGEHQVKLQETQAAMLTDLTTPSSQAHSEALLGASKRTLKEELADELGDVEDDDDPTQFLLTVTSSRPGPLGASALSEVVGARGSASSSMPVRSAMTSGIRRTGSSASASFARPLHHHGGPLDSIVSAGSESVSSSASSLGFVDCRCFSPEQLRLATDGFAPSNLLGRGSYGPVFRGELLGCAVAVKRLEAAGGQGGIEFRTEVDVLSRCRHPNIVLLMGHCPEECSLVYEYLPGGSLQQRLHPELAPGGALKDGGAGVGAAPLRGPKAPLLWPDRFRIASEIASALLFLHKYEPPIIHRDLKPDNVLLDGNDISKVSDVGLARLVPEEKYECSMRVMGTVGFIDPEMMRTGEISVKADLYAFGVILLLLITGIPQVKQLHALIQDSDPGHGEERDKMKGVAILMDSLDPRAGAWPKDLTAGILTLAMQCIERDSNLRPSLETEILPFLTELARRARELKEKRQQDTHSKFLCPISKTRMRDPVVAADGFTYERQHIEKWLKTCDVSPCTGERLQHKALAPNKVLQELIQGSV